VVPKRDGGCRLGGTQATVRGRPDEQRDGILGDGAVGEAELDDVSNGVGVAGVAEVEGGGGGLGCGLLLEILARVGPRRKKKKQIPHFVRDDKAKDAGLKAPALRFNLPLQAARPPWGSGATLKPPASKPPIIVS